MNRNPGEVPLPIKLVKALGRLRDLHPDMTLLQAQVFLTVASDEGINQRELHTRLGLTDAHASRAVAMLGEYGSRTIPPLGLLVSKVSPEDRRLRKTYLTGRGKRLIDDITRDVERGA